MSPTVFCNKDKPSSSDCDKLCPIHKKAHPLRKCRIFREKSLEERKAFLKENGICFRCCMSSQHIAKYCKAHVKCTDCGSENHDTALHIYIYIYIYAFSRRFYPKRLTLHSLHYSFYILSALAFPGNRTHDLSVASAMLYQLSFRKAPWVLVLTKDQHP